MAIYQFSWHPIVSSQKAVVQAAVLYISYVKKACDQTGDEHKAQRPSVCLTLDSACCSSDNAQGSESVVPLYNSCDPRINFLLLCMMLNLNLL